MAREIQRGANSVEGVEATLWQVAETLPSVVLQKMKAPPKPDDVPVIRVEQLVEADGFLCGFPSRFGVMAAQCVIPPKSTMQSITAWRRDMTRIEPPIILNNVIGK
ncbi:putative NAD(P)H dehydrogenase (quinone) [Helianthus anomalus]